MQEQQIADKLKQNLPPPPAPVAPTIAPVNTEEPSANIPNLELDEITLYKLNDFFGIRYSPYENETNNRINFIYETIAEQIGTRDYGFIVQEIARYQQMLGANYADDRLFKVYKWMKLDSMRKSTEAEMGALL